MEGTRYLKQRYDLNRSPEVQSSVRRSLARGEKVSQDPLSHIQNYFDRFKEITARVDEVERQRGINALKQIIYRDTIIAAADVPESYFELQKRLALENNREELSLTVSKKQEMVETVQADQKESLDHWIDCLTGPDEYPDWAKYWVMRSVLAIGPYDIKKHEYSKRSKATTKGFPELNEEALSYIVDLMTNKLKGDPVENPVENVPNPHNPYEEKKFTDEQFEQLLTTENFAKYYAFAIEHAISDNRELFHVIDGEWKVFPQGSDPGELSALLQGHGTGWCTAGKAMAQSQLQSGDFYVYCSNNALGEPVIPRVAIRKYGDSIAEVRGVEKGQDMDSFITPVVREKMAEFGEAGKLYIKKAENVDALSSIEDKIAKAEALSVDDLRFVYELDGVITTFGSNKNPKVREILSTRNLSQDLRFIYDVKTDTEAAKNQIQNGKVSIIADNLSKFSHLSKEVSDLLMDRGFLTQVVRNLESFTGVDLLNIQEKVIEARQWDTLIYNAELFPEAFKDQNLIDTLISEKPELVIASLQNLSKQVVGLDVETIKTVVFDNWVSEENLVALITYSEYFSDEHIKIIFEKTCATEPLDGRIVTKLRYAKNLKGSTAQALVEASYVRQVAENLKSFEAVPLAVAGALIKDGYGHQVIYYISRVAPSEHDAVLHELVVGKQIDSLRNGNAYSFRGVTSERLLEIIDAGFIEQAKDLINKDSVAEQSLSLEVAKALIDVDAFRIYSGMGYYPPETHQRIAEYLIERGAVEGLLRNLDEFSAINYQEIADDVIEKGELETLAKNLNRFQGLRPEMAWQLIEAGYAGDVAYNINSFEGVDYQKIADRLIEDGQFQELARGVEKFRHLNEKTALALIEAGQGIGYPTLDAFAQADLKVIAKALGDNNKSYIIQQNIELFQKQLSAAEMRDVLVSAKMGLEFLLLENIDSDEVLEYITLHNLNSWVLETYEEMIDEEFNAIVAMNESERKELFPKEQDAEFYTMLGKLRQNLALISKISERIAKDPEKTDQLNRFLQAKEIIEKIVVFGQSHLDSINLDTHPLEKAA